MFLIFVAVIVETTTLTATMKDRITIWIHTKWRTTMMTRMKTEGMSKITFYVSRGHETNKRFTISQKTEVELFLRLPNFVFWVSNNFVFLRTSSIPWRWGAAYWSIYTSVDFKNVSLLRILKVIDITVENKN